MIHHVLLASIPVLLLRVHRLSHSLNVSYDTTVTADLHPAPSYS